MVKYVVRTEFMRRQHKSHITLHRSGNPSANSLILKPFLSFDLQELKKNSLSLSIIMILITNKNS